MDYGKVRQIFRQAGARVDDSAAVFLPVTWCAGGGESAPPFRLYGSDPANLALQIGGGQVHFAGLGTPTRSSTRRAANAARPHCADLVRHIQLVDGCEHIHNSQMDIWPNDIPMTTIHTESIWAWVHYSRKPFGMGCYGYLPTLDMMRMMAIAVGGKEELRHAPASSPSARSSARCKWPDAARRPADLRRIRPAGGYVAGSHCRCDRPGYPGWAAGPGKRQHPGAYHPGADLPPRDAGPLWQRLDHRQHAPGHRGAGRGRDRADQRRLGSDGALLWPALRTRGRGTESKLEDVQAGIERTATLLPAVLAGVDFITCAGTLDSTMTRKRRAAGSRRRAMRRGVAAGARH